MSKLKDWIVIERKGKLYAMEAKHQNNKPISDQKVNDGEVVGYCSFAKPEYAIEYIESILNPKKG